MRKYVFARALSVDLFKGGSRLLQVREHELLRQGPIAHQHDARASQRIVRLLKHIFERFCIGK